MERILKHLACVILSSLFALFWDARLEAIQADSGPEPRQVEAVLETGAMDPRYKTAIVKLGQVETDGHVEFILKLENPFSEQVEFSIAKLQCSCLRFEPMGNVIPSKGSQLFKVGLAVPKHGNKAEGTSTITLTDADGETQVRIKAYYELTGLLTVLQRRVLLKVSEENPVSTVSVPILITPPVTFESLHVLASDSLRDLPFEIIEKEDKVFVNVTASYEDVRKGAIGGEVAIKSDYMGRIDGFYFSVNKEDFFRLQPSSLRFVKDPNDMNVLAASSLLRITAQTKTSKQSEEKAEATKENGKTTEDSSVVEEPEVRAFLNDQEVKVIVKRLGNTGVFRLKVHANGPDFEDERLDLRWQIVHDDNEATVETEAFFVR